MNQHKNMFMQVSVLLVSIFFISILTACDEEEQPVISAEEIPVEVELSEETEVNEADSIGETLRESENKAEPNETSFDDENENSAKTDSIAANLSDSVSENTSSIDTPIADLPTLTPTPLPTQQPVANITSQNNSSSSGSSYEQIFNEYKKKLTDYYNTAKGELQGEASSGKSIDALATSCSNKVSRLAEISTEGVNKMADLCVKRGGSASEYMNYGTKLESVYMDYGTKLEGVYMSGAMNSQTKAVEDAMKDLGLSGDISGQYSEEVNKAMDQYNDELNKAMDDYNQQMQDMLKQYGL